MTKPHFSFWIVAVIGLLWSLGGCLNYIMQNNPDNVAQLPDVYQLVINGRPTWATVGFAVSVFGGAVGCILLLLRRRVAVSMLLFSLIGTLVVLVYTVQVVGAVPSMMMSLLVAIALLWYATIANRKDWLR